MKKISCYSYKGGTGRTTSMANLSIALAELGSNVLMVDLDLEGAGLSIVMDVEDQVDVGIQDYFNAMSPENFDLSKLILDLKRCNVDRAGSQWGQIKGDVFFVPARVGVEERSMVLSYGDMVKRLNPLLEHFEDELGIDFVMIDSASGYGDASVATMAISDMILVFFRWSRQHLHTTVSICEFFRRVRERGQGLTYELVANSVPAKLYDDFDDLGSYLEYETGQKIMQALPENDEMKWRERVILFDETPANEDIIQGFRSLARLIANKYTS